MAMCRPARAAAARTCSNPGGVLGLRAVREIEAEDVGAGRDQRVDTSAASDAGPSVAMIFVCRTCPHDLRSARERALYG